LKKLYVIALFYSLVCSFAALGQTPGSKGKKTNPNQLQHLTGVGRDTCLNKKFSIVFYIIQDSTQNKNITAIETGTIPVILNILNTGFSRICVSFQSCSTVVIPNYSYNKWTEQAESIVTSSWYTENTINIYLVEYIDDVPEQEMTGYAHAPKVRGAKDSKKDVVVYQYVTIAPDDRDNVLSPNAAGFVGSNALHIMCHYFGLPDTFSETQLADSIITREKVRRTNCDIAGDGFCDTEADPFPRGMYPPPAPPHTYCYYYHNHKDLKGDYFTPPVDNIMSMWTCRCRLTQQQYNHMAKFILRNRMNLH
jgi:hypothetical protein